MAGEDRYRLTAVRVSREREERSRRGDLAAAVGDAREAQVRLEAARARTEAARAAVTSARTARDVLLAAGAASHDVLRAEQFISRRMRELDAARAEEVRCEVAAGEQQGQVEAARLTLAKARGEREVIERHFSRWRDERRKLAERRED